MQGQTDDAATSLRRAIELRPDDALEAQVLLAALIRRDEPGQSAQLARTALTQPDMLLTPFRRGELRALAHLLAGDPDAALAELHLAVLTRTTEDSIERPVHTEAKDPPTLGLDRLLATWADSQERKGAVSRGSRKLRNRRRNDGSNGR